MKLCGSNIGVLGILTVDVETCIRLKRADFNLGMLGPCLDFVLSVSLVCMYAKKTFAIQFQLRGSIAVDTYTIIWSPECCGTSS